MIGGSSYTCTTGIMASADQVNPLYQVYGGRITAVGIVSGALNKKARPQMG